MDSWYVYLILTSNDTIYTGIAKNVEKRFQEHCDTANGIKNSRGAKFFRTTQPKKIIHIETFNNRGDASKREIEIKKMSQKQKRTLQTQTTET